MKPEDVETIFDSLFISCKPGLNPYGDTSALVASRQYPSIRSFLRKLENLNAPQLEDLRMDLQWESDVANIFVEVPRKVFGGHSLERLRSARLNYVLLRSPRTFVWPALREAELTNSQAWDSSASFIAFFSGVPLLEDFKFTRNYGGTGGGLPALDTTSVDGLPPLRSIPLVNLKSFVLHGPYYDIFFTLALLGIPCTTSISLTLTGRWIAEFAKQKLQIMRDALAVHFALAAQADTSFDSVTFTGRVMSAKSLVSSSTRSTDVLPSTFSISIIPDEDILSGRAELEALDTLASHPVFTRTPNLTLKFPTDDQDDGTRTHFTNCLKLAEIRHICELFTSFKTLSLHGTYLCGLFCHSILHKTTMTSLRTLRLVGVELSQNWEERKSCVMIDFILKGIRSLGERFERLELERCIVREADLWELRKGLRRGGMLVLVPQ
ncbi:unnamed protein product [Peniophora sp. CBMAI 1063]|nr:unnamed protein product [Peniophora sp. CBMAI 1063]